MANGNGKANHSLLNLKRLKMSRSNRGFSLIETLVAVAIVGTAVAGLSGAIVSMKQANDKSKTIYSALSLQSQIIAQIADEENFRASGVAVAPNAIAGLPIAGVNVPRNTITYFTNDLTACTAFGGSCTLSVLYDFSPDATSGVWRAAYRIRSSPTLDLAIANLGAPGNATFAVADYTVPLPDLVWKSQNALGCTGASDLALMGFDRNTGVPICLKKPVGQATCPAGKFSKTFTVDYAAPGGPQLVLDCQLAGQGVTSVRWQCPPNYNLQTISNPKLFDPSYSGPAPTCVWRADATQTIGTTSSAENLVGTVCPRPPGMPDTYTQTGTACTTANGASTAGSCMTIPACPSSIVPFPATVPPTFSTSSSGDSITCNSYPGLTPPAGTCFSPGSADAIWYGVVSFGPRTCTLTIPQTVSATAI
jgi:prepilin-type N-terminal cleavage/methylation domain-containing protein